MAVRPNMGVSSASPVASAPSLTSTDPTRTVNKFERIRLVRYLGLNTEDSVLIQSESDLEGHADFLSALDRCSVRTFRQTRRERGEPHFPIVSRAEFHSACVPLLKEGYSLIVARAIDPAEAALAGCIVRRPLDYLVEIALGPGTVRRVTHEGQIDQRLELKGPQDPAVTPGILEALQALRAAERLWARRILLTDVLYEFSVYRLPVGWRNQPVIFWEIEGLGVKDAELDRFYREEVGP